ncbi:MAG: GNAT family N-acetyltransferase [Kangiellaceae bacterium]|nr:GNAT family N-acetyltransferase [Kangiellaceae bacterium]MCW9000161.1 GNAT family N-acetyltransferase [Kangiellaceae bacterium]
MLHVRQVDKTEWLDLKNLAIKTFVESFAKDNTAEDMQIYIDQSFSDAQVRKELAKDSSFFYFVINQDEPVGYLKLNTGEAQSEDKLANSVEIERIYVDKNLQGQGVGQLLFSKALEFTQSAKAEYLWLGVWEKNTGAIRFYQRLGFESFDTHSFYLGKDKQTDILMKLKV